METGAMFDATSLARIEKMPDIFQSEEVLKEFKGSLTHIVRNAKLGAPVDTGNLRARITRRGVKASREGLIGNVGTNVYYGIFQEFGTGRRGRSSYVAASRGSRLPTWYKWGIKQGIQAQAYLTLALNLEERLYLIPNITRGMIKAWNRIAGF